MSSGQEQVVEKVKVKKIFREISHYLTKKRKVIIGSFELSLPAGHNLPIYLHAHKKYDQFLPFFVSFFDDNEVIIDVGANCGDTLASMVIVKPALKYICIEPDNCFFSFLEKNTQLFKLKFPKLQVLNLNMMVGNLLSSALLSGKGGTKNMVPSASPSAMKSSSLDDIVKNDLSGFCDANQIRLIKSDVDGYDWDVLNSGKKIIGENFPFLYFECQVDNIEQKAHYSDLFLHLKNNEYSWFVLFDNFGQVLVRTDNINIIENLLDYTWSQTLECTTRTIFYYDVLAYTAKEYGFVERIITTYKVI